MSKDYCADCGQVEWLCICEPEVRKCEDCSEPVKVTLSPYGSSMMATIECPLCGLSYDTDLDPTDYEVK